MSNLTNPNCDYNPCEFTIPIKLNVPIDIYPQVKVHPAPVQEEKLPVYLKPDLFLTPKVLALPNECECIPANGYNKYQ
jgi:hypothetical protein